mmetsp:Transcript_8309/g.24980  ORF Transcript_8309/g.24980 Transcript_8309/m.24980 type:complete len:118 (+) Transcript_8309:283-636(+)
MASTRYVLLVLVIVGAALAVKAPTNVKTGKRNCYGNTYACKTGHESFKATSDKDISNVVVFCKDGSYTKFDSLGGYEFYGTVHCTIVKICVKSGCNKDPSCSVGGCGECTEHPSFCH